MAGQSRRPREENYFQDFGNMDYSGAPEGGYGGYDMPEFGQDTYQPPREYNFGEPEFTQGPEARPWEIPGMPSDSFRSSFNETSAPSVNSANVDQDLIKPQRMNPYMNLEDIFGIVDQRYKPETAAMERFNTLIGQQPEYEQPSFGRRLVASFAGLGAGMQDPKTGYQISNQILDAPYVRKMAGWKESMTPAQQAATMEGTRNAQERALLSGLATNVASQNKAQQQYELGREKNEETERKNRETAENARARNEIMAFKATHPNWTFDFKGPEGWAYDPLDPTKKVNLGPTGRLSDMDKYNLQGDWSVKAAEARGAAAVQTAQASAQASGRDLIVVGGVTYQRNDDGSYTPAQGLPGGTPTRPGAPPRQPVQTEKEKEEAVQNELRTMAQMDPSTVDKGYIVKGDDGKYYVGQAPGPTGWFWDRQPPDPKELKIFEAIRDRAYPGYKSVIPPTPQMGPYENEPVTFPNWGSPGPIQNIRPEATPSPSITGVGTSLGGPALMPGQAPSSPYGIASPNPSIGPTTRPTVGPPEISTPGLNRPPLPEVKATPEQRSKAADILRANGKAVTAANIDYLIRTNQVR